MWVYPAGDCSSADPVRSGQVSTLLGNPRCRAWKGSKQTRGPFCVRVQRFKKSCSCRGLRGTPLLAPMTVVDQVVCETRFKEKHFRATLGSLNLQHPLGAPPKKVGNKKSPRSPLPARQVHREFGWSSVLRGPLSIGNPALFMERQM